MNQDAFERFLKTPEGLLNAREAQMITRVEWEELARAVTGAKAPAP